MATGTEAPVKRLLLNKADACRAMGGISERKLDEIAGEYRIPIGHGVYYRPSDLETVVDRLGYRQGA